MSRNYRLKVTLADGRELKIDREFLCECESLAARFESEGSTVEFWNLKGGQEVSRFMHSVKDPVQS